MSFLFYIYQLLQGDLLILQMEVTFSARKRSRMDPNEGTLKNLVNMYLKLFP